MGIQNILERYQNPTPGSTILLKFFVLNSNMTAEVQAINQVSIYYLDPEARTAVNPEGRVLVQTIPGSSIANPRRGEYVLTLFVDPKIYTEVGRYIDDWEVVFQEGDLPANHAQLFQIYPELWYTTPIPIVYDFSFYFQPNRIRYGEVKSIEIEVIPNVPRATDSCAYYENLAIAAQIFVFISQRCGECVPCESDLALIVDRQPIFYKEKNRGYYKIDTRCFDCGIYNIWFELLFGENIYISETNQLQIYS